ncbi:MAG: hypothetical protein V1800_01105 [Candidatus Latescibacterota bacterium]
MFRAFPALLMVCILGSGCSEDRALARVKLYDDTLLTKEMVVITIDDGQSKWRFGSSSLHSNSGGWSTPEIETRKEGTLLVDYQFKDSEGVVVSTGQVKLGLRRDWRWGIDVFHSDQNPYHMCMGCFGYESFPIMIPAYVTSDSDSVFVIWGGNSISNPVVY